MSVLFFTADGVGRCAVVADSLTHAPLAHASVFNRDGMMVGLSRNDGSVACASPSDYPITIRYIGYCEKSVGECCADTIFLNENIAKLPEVIVEAKQRKMLHILAYMREYSTLASYTDTITMFREKMVDFMLPDGDSRYKGWRRPRLLNSRSYYRFTNANGLDSVSDRCHQHFTWSDWIGMFPSYEIPSSLVGISYGADTVSGKYSPTEIWVKKDGNLSVDVDVMADATSRKWVPGISAFFNRRHIDFEQFHLRLNYGDVTGSMVCPLDLTGYSFNIESRGRGDGVFHFNRCDEPFFVTTYTEVYILDKEFVSVKDAKKWEHHKFDVDAIAIYEPQEAPGLHPSTLALIDRVNSIDAAQVRVAITPDHRMVSRNVSKRNFAIGNRALAMLKQLTGITYYKSHKNVNHHWREFRDGQKEKNRKRD